MCSVLSGPMVSSTMRISGARPVSKLAKLVSQENQLYTTYHVMEIIFDYYMFHNYMESCRDIYLVHLVDTDMLLN